MASDRSISELRVADEICEPYEEIKYRGSKVLQRWRGSGGNWNMRVTFAYLVY